jgi:predicted acyl esterase
VSAGTDADFIVKLIDVYPDDYSPSIPNREADAADAEDQEGRPWNAPPLDPAEMTVRAIASVAATELDRYNLICQDTPQTDSNLTRQLQLMFPPRSDQLASQGYQQLVRAEPFRGKYRDSFEHPIPFVPDEPSTISFSMPDICHCFRKGAQNASFEPF